MQLCARSFQSAVFERCERGATGPYVSPESAHAHSHVADEVLEIAGHICVFARNGHGENKGVVEWCRRHEIHLPAIAAP